MSSMLFALLNKRIELITAINPTYATNFVVTRKIYVSEIGAVVGVVDSHLCRWGSIANKSCSFL